LRILLVSGIYPPDIGGPATYVAALASTLTERGHDVRVVTLTDADPAVSDESGVMIRRFARAARPSIRFRFLVAAVRREAASSDVVYVNGLYLESALACAGLGCRTVAKVVGDWAWERAVARGWFEPDIEAFQSARLTRRNGLLRELHRRALRRMDLVIVPSAYLGRLVDGWDVSAARIVVVPNTLVPSEGLPQRGGDQSQREIIAVGRLVPWKRFDDLVTALAKVPDCTLDVVGDGPEEERLRRCAADQGVDDRMTFAGAVSREETLRRLASARAIVLPSSYEGWPHVLVEAMGVGTPVIAAHAGGTPELVRDGENGLLVPVGDTAALADAIRRVLDDPALVTRLRDGGRRTVDGWTWEQLAGRTESILAGRDRCAVLMIGTNESLLDADAEDDTVRRLVLYGKRIDRLNVIVCTSRVDVSSQVCGGSVAATPVTARGRWARYLHATGRGVEIARNEAITIVQAQEPVFAGPAAWRIARRTGARLVTVAYGVDPWDTGYRATGVAERIASAWSRAVLRASDHVLVDTASAKAGFVEQGIPEDRITVKPMVPPDLEMFSELDRDEGRRRLELEPDRWLLWTGRASRQKNLPLLEALVCAVQRELPDVRWMVVGPSPREGWPASVRWMGQLDRPAMAAAVAACNAVVVTSYYEGFARIYMEAGWAERPVLTTPTAGARDVVSDGVSGLVYERDDIGGFIRGLRRVLDGVEGASLGTELGRRVRERLAGIDDIGVQLEVWRRVMERGRDRR
jgi:glycosyltransferase involved in cell wall biosynthesis